MASLLLLTYSAPTLEIAKGVVLISQGSMGNDLYVLDSGRLAVERDGVKIAIVEQFDSVVGEMALLLGKPHSATVRAETDVKVRVVRDALKVLERNPDITLRLAAALCNRLDATSELVSQLSRDGGGKAVEQGLIGRIMSSVFSAPAPKAGA